MDRAVYDAAAPLVNQVLGGEIAHYVLGTGAAFERSLREDPALAKALSLLQGVTSPAALLARVPAAAKK